MISRPLFPSFLAFRLAFFWVRFFPQTICHSGEFISFIRTTFSCKVDLHLSKHKSLIPVYLCGSNCIRV